MVKKIFFLFAFLIFILAGCAEKDATENEGNSAQEAAQTESALTKTPDVGGVESVEVTAEGAGITPGAALNEALKTAIMQVNGAAVAAGSVNIDFVQRATGKIDIDTKDGSDTAKLKADIQGQAFANVIISESAGVITSFKVTNIETPGMLSFLDKDSANYKVTIEARVAQFKGPADKKLKVIISPLTTERTSFTIDGQTIPAKELLASIRQQMIDALTNTGRFIVLDRQFDSEREEELYRIGQGRSNRADMAKFGQELSADVVWIGHINHFSRQGKASGWSVSQRMINLTTSGILLSSTVEGQLPASFSGDNYAALTAMKQEFVKRTTDAILLQMFPISVIKLEGNTVKLSQGGNSVRENARYKLYLLGEELIDPQTGESLGHDEKYCCDVVITRVQPKFSEGVLENIQLDLTGVKPGKLQLREAMSVAKVSASQEEQGEKKPARQATARKPRAAEKEADRTGKAGSANDKDW